MIDGPNDPPGTGETPEPVETPDNTPDTSQPNPQPADDEPEQGVEDTDTNLND